LGFEIKTGLNRRFIKKTGN